MIALRDPCSSLPTSVAIVARQICQRPDAATGVVVGTSAVMQSFLVDRPFLYFIRDRATGAILFAGRVLDPRG